MSLRAILRELAGYAVASATALAADMVLLAALTSVLGWHYLLASALSFTVGGLVAYALSVRLAFRFHHLSTGVELISFVALGSVGLLVNSLVIWIAVARLGLAVMASKACAALCTFSVNFLIRRQVLFAAPRHPAVSAVRATE